MDLIYDNIEEINSFDYLSNEEYNYMTEAYRDINLNYFCKLNNKIYHKKRVYEEDIIDEFLGKIISEYFGDKHIESKIIIGSINRLFLLTENFIEEGHLYTNIRSNIFCNLKFDDRDRLDLFNLDLFNHIRFNEIIVNVKKEDLIKLKYSLKMMIINDYMRKQCDRVFRNFMFEYKFNRIKLMPLYDFEYSFFNSDNDLENTFKFDLDDKNVIDYVRNDNQFQELLYLGMDLNMDKIFEKLFDLYPVRLNNKEMDKYKNIIDEKKKEIKEYKLIRS